MSKYGYLVVEGPHDIAVVGRLLSPWKFQRVRYQRDLDAFWHYLVPKKFPPDDDLLKRVPMPLFFRNSNHVIAVQSAGGDTALITALERALITAQPDQMRQLVGIGLIFDSDNQLPAERLVTLTKEAAQIGLTLPSRAGEILPGSPKTGVFVLPDNISPGTLEDILLECAAVAYPKLLAGAQAFIATVNPTDYPRRDRRDFQKPAGRKKALVGSIGSVLRPGKAIQVSIQDNGWLRGAALDLPHVKAIQDFLAELLELP